MNDVPREIIRFELDPEEWHNRPSEGLWGEPVSSLTETAYRLLNSPFFITGVSYLDIVRVVRQPDEGGLAYSGVVERGGHSTYMVLTPLGSTRFGEFLNRLQLSRCSYESKTMDVGGEDKVLYSIDVPADADLYEAYSILEDGEKNGVWVFQEGHVGHLLHRQKSES